MSLGLNLSRGSNSLYSAFENFTIAEYQDQSLSIFFVKVNLILRFYPGECLKIQTIREALRNNSNSQSGVGKFEIFSAPFNERTLIGRKPVGISDIGKIREQYQQWSYSEYSD